MHSATLQICPTTVVKDDELSRLCARLSQGLHALAQPLTILRSALVASTAPGISAVEQRRYLDLSTQHMERICGLFECLQDVVIASHMDAECEPILLSDVLAVVVQDQKVVLEAGGVELRVLMPETLPSVLGDVNRTLQALSAALIIAASVSSPGDLVEFLVSAGNGNVELVLQNRRIHGRRPNSSERLSLALAEANIRSQHGEYEYDEDPFRVSFALPLQDGLP